MTDRVLAVLGRGVVDPAEPIVRADDLALIRGEGVFETLRVAAGRAWDLDLHLRRLAESAARLAIVLPRDEEWCDAVDAALKEWPHSDGVMRLVCTKGGELTGAAPVGFALVTPIPEATLEARERGVSAITLAFGVPAGLRPRAPWLLGGVKSTSYAVNMASLRAAAAAGVDDVVWVSSDRDPEVLEAPTATVAWVDHGRIVTPPPAAVGVLAGTTVKRVLELADRLGFRTVVRRGTLTELREAKEAMLLSSVRGVAPLLRLDGAGIGGGVPGPVTVALREALEDLVTGKELPDAPTPQ